MISPNTKQSAVQRGATTSQVDRAEQRLLLRGGEVASVLGISRALAFRWMQDGTLPTVRIAGARTVRVPEDALREWIRANTRGAGLKPLAPVAGSLR